MTTTEDRTPGTGDRNDQDERATVEAGLAPDDGAAAGPDTPATSGVGHLDPGSASASSAPDRLKWWQRFRSKQRKRYLDDYATWESDRLAEPPQLEFDESFLIRPTDRYEVFNRTPYLIQLKHPDPHYGEIRLPPYAERIIKGGRLRPFDEVIRGHRQRHEIFVRKYGEDLAKTNRLIWPIWLALLILLAVITYDVFVEGTLNQPEFYITSAIAAAVIVVMLLVGAVREIHRRRDANDQATEAGDVAHGVGSSFTDGNETARAAHHMLTLLIVIFVGAVIPAIAIIVATDTRTFLNFDGGLRIDPADGGESRLVGRLIQITYTIVLSLFPALLFFQFDRQRAGSLRAEWVRNLFRMDRRLRTLADVHAVYGDGMYDASGNSEDSVRLLGGKHSPIVVATILIMLGWTILVIRTDSYDFRGSTIAALQVEAAASAADAADQAAAAAVDAADEGDAIAAREAADQATAAAAAAQAAEQTTAEITADGEGTSTTVPPTSEPPVTTIPVDELPQDQDEAAQALADQAAAEAAIAAENAQASADATEVGEAQITSKPFLQLLAPNPSAAGMAFLGAYFFGVYLLLRSYFRGDLRPKVYNQIAARLVTVVVLAYVINALLVDARQQGLVWALAFLAGVVPSAVLDALLKGMNGFIRRLVPETINPPRPLEHIDGIDIYDSSRLEAEGIPDVAALANSDLATLMFNTRLPIGRLIDWADQAVMMVVVSPGATPITRHDDSTEVDISALTDPTSTFSQRRATKKAVRRKTKIDRTLRRGIDPRIMRLRDRGIRTGTDLLDAVEGRKAGSSREVVEVILGEMPPDDGERPETERVATESSLQEQESTVGPEQSTASVAAEVEDLPDADIGALCRSIRRQPVMAQILAWRSSPLADVDRAWIELPAPGADVPENRTYSGPMPDAPQPGVPQKADATT